MSALKYIMDCPFLEIKNIIFFKFDDILIEIWPEEILLYLAAMRGGQKADYRLTGGGQGVKIG